mmetsp:Transcript_90229/g.250750  ORF Transcript_90229/g.250750 Transcript_90229/m.250750 type:complete len:230 (+) Transcript_90229:620-1309(+)
MVDELRRQARPLHICEHQVDRDEPWPTPEQAQHAVRHPCAGRSGWVGGLCRRGRCHHGHDREAAMGAAGGRRPHERWQVPRRRGASSGRHSATAGDERVPRGGSRHHPGVEEALQRLPTQQVPLLLRRRGCEARAPRPAGPGADAVPHFDAALAGNCQWPDSEQTHREVHRRAAQHDWSILVGFGGLGLRQHAHLPAVGAGELGRGLRRGPGEGAWPPRPAQSAPPPGP